MALQTYDSPTLLRRMASSLQGGLTQVINLGVGSVLLPFLEAVRDVGIWLQSLVIGALQAARLSTAAGADVDSFVGDFSLTRLAAVSATGTVTFGRSSTTNQALIPSGTQVQTADGTQSFTVIADTTQSAWNASLNAYVIPVGTANIAATVQAVTAGTAGNVNAGTITVISAPIQFVTTVTNGSAFTNGAASESDAAVKARFALYLAGLSKGIKAAVASVIANLNLGIQYTLTENQTYAGATQNGFFYLVISPGSTSNQNAVYSAVDAIRPLGSTFAVYAATNVTANIVMTATAATGYTHAQIATAIQTALTNYFASLALGQKLEWSYLYSVIYAVVGVQEVTGLTVNGGTSDLTPTSQQIVALGTVTVN